MKLSSKLHLGLTAVQQIMPARLVARQGHLYSQHCSCRAPSAILPLRTLRTTTSTLQDLESHSTTPSEPPPPPSSASSLPDPTTAHTPAEEAALSRAGIRPIGSRRRRAALASSSNIAFERLPYQCFQEARKIIAADRERKIQEISTQRARIERVKQQDVVREMDNASQRRTKELQKGVRVRSMQRELEKLKVLADVNDPVVKKKFEDGFGDLNKPIYRYYAQRKWQAYRQKILEQRIAQMNIVPDVIPSLEFTADAELSFGRKDIAPGAIVPSAISEHAPQVKVQVFDRGERLVSIAVVDADVPNTETDGFDYRLHYLACNIPISPTNGTIKLGDMQEGQNLISPWLAPYAQKGTPYHRLCVFVMQQSPDETIDIAKAKEKVEDQRANWKLRAFVDRHRLKPFTAFLFRTQWDEEMEGLMKRMGVEGWDVEFKHKRVEPMPYRRKPSHFDKYRG
ncbi:MAG: hypothetical protein M1828_000202 [Chrysothrix sp. TS-e1954]|nr:MAG: hypothetical protein M1828_000202 [Chrysothrix sp. TS-e1954]